MEKEIEEIEKGGARPTLLLQCCCAPCSSAVLERLIEHFDLKIFFYNPNIYPEQEYEKRSGEFEKILLAPEFAGKIEIIPSEYRPEDFENAVKGLENEKEGGARCEKCFRLRLFETAKKAVLSKYRFELQKCTAQQNMGLPLIGNTKKAVWITAGWTTN